MIITPDDVTNFFTSWGFINIGIPIVTVVFGVYVKVVSRPDKDLRLRRDDLAIGFDIALGALMVFMTKMVTMSQDLSKIPDAAQRRNLEERVISAPWMLMFWVFGFWGLSTIVRMWGREMISREKPAIGEQSATVVREVGERPSRIVGLFLPFLFGIASLYFALNWTGGER